MEDEEYLRKQTEVRLGAIVEGEMEPICKGGSDRRYFRLRVGGQSIILMAYGLEREENGLFAGIGRVLRAIDVRVPRIVAQDVGARLIWVEDLGAEDLHSRRGEGWNALAGYYQDALDQVARMHREGLGAVRRLGVPLMPGFDEALYRWERDYFYQEFVRGVCGLQADVEKLERELGPRARVLAAGTRVLVHRDFQSQNIMVHRGLCHLIDFQGAREGSPFYDVASLLLDPYVELPEAGRADLLGAYLAAVGWSGGRSEGEGLFRMAGVQRLMQALGAYGLLGVKRGKKNFLNHIAPALGRLQALTEADGGLPVLNDWVRRCREVRNVPSMGGSGGA